MDKLGTLIVQDGGWIALAVIILLLILALLVYTVYKLVMSREKSGEVVTIQAESNADIVKALVEPFAQFVNTLQTISTEMKAIGIQMQTLADCLVSHDENSKTERESFARLIGETKQTAESNAILITAVPGQVKEIMSPELEKLPKAIKDELTPDLDSLKKVIEDQFSKVNDNLEQRPDKASLQAALDTLKVDLLRNLQELIVAAKLPAEPPALEVKPEEPKADVS